jgi:N-methylhydantoinase B
MGIDKVTLGILANHTRAAVESMAYTLLRTAHAVFVSESQDFTSTLVTAEGKTFTYHQDTGTTWMVTFDCQGIIKLIDDYEEGDICITNDPYSGYVVTHIPDIILWKPIFWEKELVCFATCFIHHTDVGGAIPTSVSRSNTEIYQEGIRVTPRKLVKRGDINRDVLEMILSNVRAPEQSWGDLKAQIASMNTGERKVHEMIRKFGIETFKQGIHDLIDTAELQARDIVSSVPDGEYRFTDFIDEDCDGGLPVRLAACMTVTGDEIILDFAGSDPQLASALNVPTGGGERPWIVLNGFVSAFYTLNPRILLNCGLTLPIRCIFPEGSVLNPQFPAALNARTIAAVRLQDIILGLLTQAAPDRLPAAAGGAVVILNVTSHDERAGHRVVTVINPIFGGGGGNPRADGANGAGGNCNFLMNTPIEITEAHAPIDILAYELKQDTGGPGLYRGGCATRMEFQVHNPSTINMRNKDRSKFQAWGVLGGHPGKAARYLINPGTSDEVDTGNADRFDVAAGDIVSLISTTGGGWGSPLDREPAAVLADVERDFISAMAAERDYGVVIGNGKLDPEATDRKRAELRLKEKNAHFSFGAFRDEFEQVWNAGTYEALSEVLSTLPAVERFSMKHRIFAALQGGTYGRDKAAVYKAFAAHRSREASQQA